MFSNVTLNASCQSTFDQSFVVDEIGVPSIDKNDIDDDNMYWWVHNSTPNQCKKCDVSLIVYKRLPPRDAYALINEEDPSATLPEGCMWETFCRQADNDDDEDGKIIMQDYWRQVAPPYIIHQQDYPNLLEPLIITCSC